MYLIITGFVAKDAEIRSLNPYSNGTMYLMAKIVIDYILRY